MAETAGVLVSDVLARVRDLLKDPDANDARWDDTALLRWTGDAVGEIYRVRPDAASIDRVVTRCPSRPTAATHYTGIAVSYLEAIVAYVCSMAFRRDADHQGNAALADSYMAEFRRLLT